MADDLIAVDPKWLRRMLSMADDEMTKPADTNTSFRLQAFRHDYYSVYAAHNPDPILANTIRYTRQLLAADLQDLGDSITIDTSATNQENQ